MGEAVQDPPIGKDVADLLRLGVAVVLATRDAALRPQIGRAWGPLVSDGGHTLTLCVEARAGSRVRENLDSLTEAAVNATQPSTYRSVQMKGQVTAVTEPIAEQVAAAKEHFAAFAADASEVGIPPRMAPRFFHPQVLVAVTLAVHEAYDQTPGPAAGGTL
jgi:hypothetical protein